MSFQSDLLDLVKSRKPALVMGVTLEPAGLDEVRTRSGVAIELEDASVESALLMLGGIAEIYNQVCQRMARHLGKTEEELRAAIVEQLTKSKLSPPPDAL